MAGVAIAKQATNTHDPDPGHVIEEWVDTFPAVEWVPDNAYRTCHRCSSVLTVTRHHCRLCGQLFCSACTTKKYIPDKFEKRGKKGPRRVCHGCTEKAIVIGGTKGARLPPAISFKEGVMSIHPPEWDVVERASDCFHCHSQLIPSPPKRRVLCHLCGHVFCDQCATNIRALKPAFLVPGQQLGTVCGSCLAHVDRGALLDESVCPEMVAVIDSLVPVLEAHIVLPPRLALSSGNGNNNELEPNRGAVGNGEGVGGGVGGGRGGAAAGAGVSEGGGKIGGAGTTGGLSQPPAFLPPTHSTPLIVKWTRDSASKAMMADNNKAINNSIDYTATYVVQLTAIHSNLLLIDRLLRRQEPSLRNVRFDYVVKGKPVWREQLECFHPFFLLPELSITPSPSTTSPSPSSSSHHSVDLQGSRGSSLIPLVGIRELRLEAEALFEYKSTRTGNYLRFDKGDKLVVTNTESSQWWWGYLEKDPSHHKGWFPANHVVVKKAPGKS